MDCFLLWILGSQRDISFAEESGLGPGIARREQPPRDIDATEQHHEHQHRGAREQPRHRGRANW